MSSIPGNAYLILIGAMKSGTTSLYSYLVQHPQICECKTKEPNFFSQQLNEVTTEKYQELWEYDDSRHRYVLEGSTGYTKYPMRKDIPERISRCGIDPLFIYILRDPFERIESHYNAARFNPEWKLSIMDDHLINTSNYFMQLERYRKYFPKEKFLLLDFVQLKTDPEKVLSRIYDFLHLDHSFFPDSFHRKNETVYVSRFELIYRKLIRTVGINRIIPESLKKLGRRVHAHSTPVKRRLLTEEERKRVYGSLEGDMIKLRDEYDFDVRNWGFGTDSGL